MKRLIFAVVFLPFAALAQTGGASLYFTPIAANAPTGGELVVRVMLNTAGQAVNAADGKILFDSKELTVERIETDGSIFNSWATAPRYDNAVGEIVFGGSLSATTTYTGERGEILRVVFRGLRSGETRVRFDTASAILAGDGTGGNILAETKVGVYVFSPTESAPPETVTEESGAGEVLGAQTQVIVSKTHPEEGVWHRGTEGTFSWTNSPSVMRVLTGISSNPTARGSRVFTPPIDTRTLAELPEGETYFIVTQEYADGTERTMRYHLKIDASPPEMLEVREDDERDPTEPNPRFFVTATDSVSGIARYELFLDDQMKEIRSDEIRGGELRLSNIPFGDHRLRIVAYDHAGNSLERSIEFSVSPLDAPSFILSRRVLSEGDRVEATGSALPNSTLRVYLRPEGSEASVESVAVGSDGTFHYTGMTKLSPGMYRVSADILDARGATSDRIAEETITVKTSIWGMIQRHPMILVAALLALLCLMAFGIGLWWFMKKQQQKGSIENPKVFPPEIQVQGGGRRLKLPGGGPVHIEQRTEAVLKEEQRFTAGENGRDDRAHPRPIMNQGVIDLRPMG